MAEWLRSGLQIRVCRFDSGRHLQFSCIFKDSGEIAKKTVEDREHSKNRPLESTTPGPTPGRRRLFIAISVAFLLIVVEGSSYGFLTGYLHERHARFFHFDLNTYVDGISEEYFARAADRFDPDLGWDNVPGNQSPPRKNCAGDSWSIGFDALGSRNNPHRSDDVLISLYGGSYTLSEEVNDSQTWQYFLSESTGTKVLNFGVGGYGPDQALVKLKRNLERGIRTPIVVLGLYSAGIRRVVNAYRPYYGPHTGIKLGFKPLLVERDGRFEWIDVPIQSIDDRAAVKAAAAHVRQYDHWYEFNKLKPRVRFPYSFALLHTAYFLVAHHIPDRDFWGAKPETVAIMWELVRQFVALGEQEGFMPVVAFLPESGELEGYRDGEPPRYERFKKRLIRHYGPAELTTLDVYEETFRPDDFMTKPGCHASAYGNRITAQAVHRAIAPLVERLKLR